MDQFSCQARVIHGDKVQLLLICDDHKLLVQLNELLDVAVEDLKRLAQLVLPY